MIRARRSRQLATLCITLCYVFSIVLWPSTVAADILSYDFNNFADIDAVLDGHFTEAENGSPYSYDANNGINESGAINVDTLENIWTTTQHYSLPAHNNSHFVSGVFYNDGNSGYGGMGLATAPINDFEGMPTTNNGLGVIFHGGGGSFTNNGVEIETLSWNDGDISEGAWYQFNFVITRRSKTSFDMYFDIWSMDAEGTIGSPHTAHTLTSVENEALGESEGFYAYFGTAGGDRFALVDDFRINANPYDGKDLNGDGIMDVEQPPVSDYTSEVTDKTIVAELAEGCEMNETVAVNESELASNDVAYEYPEGILDFSFTCAIFNNNPLPIKLYFYDVKSEDLIARKYNPVTKSFFNLTAEYNATITETTIEGHTVTVLSYEIVDGGVLDMDGAENGTIVDPVGLAQAVVDAPNTGLGGPANN